MLFCCVDRHLGLLVVRSLFVNNKEGGLCFAVIKILRAVWVFVSLLSCLVSKCIVSRNELFMAFSRGDPMSVFGKNSSWEKFTDSFIFY